MSERGRSPAASGHGTPGQGSPHPSRGPSVAASARSRGASPAQGPQRQGSPAQGSQSGGSKPGWAPSMGFDPAKPESKDRKGNTRMELPADAFLDNEDQKDVFAVRGKNLNTEGRPEMVEVNQLRMTKFDFSKRIYQYDVVLSPEPDKRGPVLKKIWAHANLKTALASYNYPMWIMDGSRLAWSTSLVDRGEIRVTVDLDDGKPPGRSGRSNKFYVMLRKTTEIQMSALRGYLERKMQFNNSVQEALNFMDHLIRQWPSENLLAIKRNFYRKNEAGTPLLRDGVITVHKGTYASLRLSNNLSKGGIGLALNADVTNTCFWTGRQTMDQYMMSFLRTLDKRYQREEVATTKIFNPVRNSKGEWQSSDAFKQLRKMRKLKFTIRHMNRDAKLAEKVYTVMDFAFDQKYGPQGGANAVTVKFDYNGREISVADYYREKYKATLKYPFLPLIATGKNGHIPMEFAFVEPMQRYAFKLNPEQTAAMIKIAVTRPNVRKGDIMRNIADLRLQQDPYLKFYGVELQQQFAKTEARVLNAPLVNFAQGTADPKYSGRWDLRGKKFFKPNVAPLTNWGFIVMDDCVQFSQLQQFARTFKTTFMGHGGICKSDALLINVPGHLKNNVAQALAHAHNQITRERGYTQLIFVVVQHKNSPHYERLKKSADCRFGVLTQVVNGASVASNNGQYHSNVCMKVNAKLGGSTSRTNPPWKMQGTYFPKDRPTMIVGVDISHAAPGGPSPSVAAMTMSVDRDATKYAAMVETNGYRVEMLSHANVHTLFGHLCKVWMNGHDRQFPKHVIYFRDGVAEGQFAHVIEQEIKEIKGYFKQAAPSQQLPKFTVIVATKRHHIRFFPEKGDRNGNALPGTLVEKEVTHPFMYDFYLNSHVAIQGTARPVHYHVLIDEMNIPVNELQKMIYHQCYSYARSTTPVSLHPAVYYAHLAGARARAHENIATSEGFRAGAKGHEMIRDKVAKGESMSVPQRGSDAPSLLQLGGKPENNTPIDGEMRQREFFRGTMWYI
ncbi:Piwi domain-containing protein [Trichoderma longibrachiatum]|uniref:Piwi-domain-containing protein n=1 Tax=Trichoderma longibrachiatum ATCC 18648 TaxID=983965 RepID=A0A2T4C7J3_TRILO|nr:Piwi-domain-containing protein [Trichoderma longibrachiatum ATCC 18648]